MLYVTDTHTLFATPLARAFEPDARFRQFALGPGVIGGLAASTPDGIWLGTYENSPARLFRFTAATLAQLSDGETLAASQATSVLTIPDHAQGAAIDGGELWIARSDWSWGTLDRLTLRPARRGAAMKPRPVSRALPSAVTGDCGWCRGRVSAYLRPSLPRSVRAVFPLGLCTRPLSFGVSQIITPR